MKFITIASIFTLSICFSVLSAQILPLRHAHSHNDYNRNIPLEDALQHGFTSIEWDILLLNGKLYVGHDVPESKKGHGLPKLKDQFLEPLFNHFQKNNGFIYPGYEEPFYVWIDVKIKKNSSYKKLNKLLKPYRTMLSHYKKGKLVPGKVTIIISGDRAIPKILKDKNRMVVLDGRQDDLIMQYPPDLMPFVSMSMWKICRTDTLGLLPPTEIEKLQTFVKSVHAQGKKVRLWATPEREEVWQQLLNCGVDLLNTDHLSKLQQFLSILPKNGEPNVVREHE